MLLLVCAGAGVAQSVPDTSWRPRIGENYNPAAISTEVEYDAERNEYVKTTKVGDIVTSRQPMTFEEYQEWHTDQLMRQYWTEKSAANNATVGTSKLGILNKIPGFEEISKKVESLLGKPEISITPSGSAELTLQVINNYRDDPALDINRRSVTTFDFDENIQISLNAKIGDLINFDLNWNTQATFDFENKIKLRYEGKEDDIIQLIEAADVSFPLNTTLIKGSQQLFGFHTKLKFGKLTIDAVVSQKETSTENMQVKGGASTQEFEIRADEYEENRHYFISQYFYDHYNEALKTLPIVASNIKILRMEVWRTNVGAAVTNNRNLLALTDLGEHNPNNTYRVHATSNKLMPTNGANDLLQTIGVSAIRSVNNITSHMQGLGFVSGTDYEKIESARLLNSNEYTYNSQLGFISLSQPLSNDQVLAVAFQYQVIGDTTVYQVGELTTDGINDPNTLVVKLLKSTATNTHGALWRLMMKNVYFLKSTQLSRENFRLNVLYESKEGGVGIGFMTEGDKEGTPYIELFGLDRMDASQNYYYADGVFDWFDSASYKGGTIQSTTGRIFFPYVEPFGKDLRNILNNKDLADKYCFDSLYTLTPTLARQYADKNKFYLEGYFTSAVSGEISLGYSVSQGSVTVTAGGVPLIENVDYTVDYTMGTVRIINEGILSSGTPISVSSENNSFSMMTKRMLGLHLNYEVEKDFNIGATMMNLYEKPLTTKNNYGDEPTSNTIWGLDLSYNHEVPFITRLVDMLPGIDTKAPSTLSLTAEFAHLIPGLANTGSADGTSTYIDDFEGAESNIDLKGVGYWFLASTPQDYRSTTAMFPETQPNSGLAYGFNRARLAWYRIDDIFYSSNCPENITVDDRSQPYARRITEQEVFPNKDLAAGEATNIYEMNLAYYPDERGPYNYEVGPTGISAGTDADGKLKDPKSRWGGIMRKLDYTDFETQNIETIEFWLMDPFIEDPHHSGGKLYINLGDISEDILRDGRKGFENGLPTGGSEENVDTTIWGRVPTTQPIVNAFDNDESARKYQDVGYDGLGSRLGLTDEQSFFAAFVDSIARLHGTGSKAYQLVSDDPSSDDYRFYRSSYYDNQNTKINDRYKYYNNPEGNSPADADNTESYTTAASTLPNVEDINKDNTLSEAENYYQYVIDLRPEMMEIGKNHIVDIQEATNVQLANGTTTNCKWYQFRIPIREPNDKIGDINGFQSIRFMRMFLNQFEKPIILRFATLELVYATWRKYSESLQEAGDYASGTTANTEFNISTVNIEENGNRQPVPYVLPPGIEREEWYSSGSSYTQLNEQALSMDITDLAQGDARAVYRSSSYDMRYYGKLKMFVHAEKKDAASNIQDGDLELFVRLGSDFTNNYYEYSLPLQLTPWYTSADQSDVIWPMGNNVEIDLTKLVDIKTNRNKAIRNGDSQYGTSQMYREMVDNRTYGVMGSPNLGKVKVIMIGVRNPRKQSVADGNDMLPKSVTVWANELRLADFNNHGGWAAMVLARTNLADLGNLSLYGSYTTAGFGNLEDKLTGLELVNQLNFQTTLDLDFGKFLPENWGVKIPFYIDHAREIGSPEYNPLDPDVKLKDDLKTFKTKAERDSLRQATQERKSATNLTLTNIRKERVASKAGEKQHFYDIENFAFSYAYTGEHNSDDEIQYFNKKQHRGGFTYAYNIQQPKEIKPFDKIKTFNNKNWRLLKEFNIYYQPKNITFSTELYRDYEETLLRNKSKALVILKPTYFKQFTWQRNYGFQYDLTRNLRLQYSAGANARIDEPVGAITSHSRDSVWKAFSSGGTMQNFTQTININWDIPINKLPYLDFLRTPLVYRTTYNFQGATMATKNLGNTLNSSTTIQISANANLQMLYNKSKLIKKAYAYDPQKEKDKAKGKERNKGTVDEKRGLQKDKVNQDSLQRAQWMERLKGIGYFGIRLATMVKSGNIQYGVTTGNRLPGYMGTATVIGLDPRYNFTPGFGYIAGFRTNIANQLARQGLLSQDTLMNAAHENTESRILSLQVSVEPIRNMKIEITATQNYSQREEYYYKYNSLHDMVEGPLSYMKSGSYTTTVWSFGTAFIDKDELFTQFLNNRKIISSRLARIANNGYSQQMVLDTMNGEYYNAGYSGNSQTVLLSSFLSTYLGKDPNSYGFSPFMKFPLPNWSINYTGLNKIKAIKKIFSNISLSHKYSSTYTIGNYYTDAAIAAINDYEYGLESVMGTTGDYIPPISMDAVQIAEQFNPLIRVAMSFTNNLQLNFSIQRNRTMALSFANNQMTETSRDGITFGGGYRIKDVAFSLKAAGKTMKFKSDIVLQLNLTHNSNKTNIRKINQNINQISSGSSVWMIELSGEYALSSTLTLRAFFQTNINTPYISNSYPNSTTKGGLTIRFSF
ncbi:MAG: cell surface protein SprA [Bacteroidales bacterium]|nr:cell surface protein SprA [Candidatus Colimorpha onthohippi]